MTWQELCKKAKARKAYVDTNKDGEEYFNLSGSELYFFQRGDIYLDTEYRFEAVALDRTPEQMLAIMEALK